MNDRLPALKAQDVISALQRCGFVIVRSKGSHQVLAHFRDATRFTIVPVHGGKDVPRHLVHTIIKQAGLTIEQFRDVL